jgi:small subunit ribosomal protein S28e
MATPATVTHVMGRMGVKGVTKIRCKVLDGNDTGKIIMRNVIGPVRVGDIILLKDTQMDASSRFQRKG